MTDLSGCVMISWSNVTEFGDTVEIFANFGTEPFEYEDLAIPGRGVAARWIDTGKIEVFFVQP